MSWLAILGIVVIVIAILSVVGLKPKGGRPVAGTQLMFMARVVLFVVGAVLLYLAYRG
jgi:hypothetical protein